MKNIKIYIALVICLKLNAQHSVAYTYDANGNRDSRYVVSMRLMNPNFSGEADSTIVLQKKVELAMEYGVSVFPNPTRDAVTVNMNNSGKNPADLEKAELFLIDNSGRTIAKKRYTDQAVFDMSNCLPGVYHLNILFNKNERLDYRIIKVN